MGKFFAMRLMQEKTTYDQVPRVLRPDTDKALRNAGREDLVGGDN